ncbi:MAG TPA: ABC transporter permease [Amaricoccus sp.]|uniref:ABC transporter permease n=1 Tax=Amaricoccus sp. TaxID=1872485 RepID=UPI002C4B171D|nr:ABC transporter permease [Amaricoccus sp.]HMQ94287.1 ABC transporter permease [Amaricoccus sp.]HMR53787.1 ABC transporter permease [Amaricoccus sp.]HMR61210.1 ABC transporter permease [Amaricoccus sp.]HMU01579.1 ABC transporter permease [Amaricoccus sp.]
MIRFVLADLRLHALGALVIVLLIASATALGMAVRIEERALRLGSARAADRFDLVVGAAGSETQLVLSSVFLQPAPLTLLNGDVLRRLSEDPRVEFAAPVGFGDSFLGYPIVGTTAEFVESLGLADGGAEPLFASLGEAIVGACVRLDPGYEITPMHGLPGQEAEEHDEIVYHVAGRLAPTATPWDRAILVPIEGVWKVHEHGEEAHDEAGHDHEADHDHDHEGHDHAHEDHGAEAATARLGPPWPDDLPGVPAIIVKPRSIANAYQLRGEYRTETTLAVFPGEVLTRLYSTLGDARQILTAIAIGTQALAAAAVLLVAMAHLAQRRRQIGALRAFGAPRVAVFGVVWAELLLVVGLGVAFGVLLGYAGAKVLAIGLSRQSGIHLPVTLEASDLGFAAVLLAVAAAIAALPAVYAYRQSPAAALRS